MNLVMGSSTKEAFRSRFLLSLLWVLLGSYGGIRSSDDAAKLSLFTVVVPLLPHLDSRDLTAESVSSEPARDLFFYAREWFD